MNGIKHTVFFLSMMLACQVFAGEYGLAISDASKSPCQAHINHDLNTCTSSAVRDDLHRFFIGNQDFRIKAVKMGYWSRAIHFEGSKERKHFYESLVSLLVSEDLKKEKELIAFMSGFPFRSMRLALENELSKKERSKKAEIRLNKVYKIVISNYRD